MLRQSESCGRSNRREPPKRLRCHGLVLCALALPACGTTGGSPSFDDYNPSSELARAAISASLLAWRDGHPRGPASALGRVVEVSDSERDPKRPLRSFAILGPVGIEDRPGFAVRLDLANPDESLEARYVVVGRNPVWVFRREDYERISHWEHKMEKDESGDGTDEPPATEPVVPPTVPSDPPHE